MKLIYGMHDSIFLVHLVGNSWWVAVKMTIDCVIGKHDLYFCR